MNLNSLVLINYKNIREGEYQFDPKINCFVGPNGIGKTNVLDAIYHLSFGKSYFNPISSQNINHESDFFMIEGTYNRSDRDEKVLVSLKRGQKKVIKRNNKVYDRLRDHIGLLPLVIISPADRDLIIEGSDTRRKFMDGVISQSNVTYLDALLQYTKVVTQRNALLKYFAANHTFSDDSIDIYDQKMLQLGRILYEGRKAFVEEFKPIFLSRYNAISNKQEAIDLIYESDLNQAEFEELLRANLKKDLALQYSSVGPHKDDLKFTINGFPIKKFGSQGQQKSFLIALKLAQFDFIKSHSKVTPILLLDDIFDKLDETRVAQIIALVDEAHFGQIFISDTHPERTEAAVKSVHQSYKIFKL